MKTGSNNIDQLFKDSLSNLEADVNPSVWENIEKELQSSSGRSADHSIRSGRILSKVKVKNIISFLILSGAAILAILYFTSKKSETPLTVPVVKSEQEKIKATEKIPTNTIVPSSGLTQQTKIENMSVEGKQNYKAGDQKMMNTETVLSDVDPTKEDGSLTTSGTSGVTDSKDKIVHQDKNSPAKSISESPVNIALSKNAEGSHDLNIGNPSVEDAGNVQSDNSPAFDTETGFAFYCPERFTPNGDGVNDFYTPKGLNFKDFEITIYDQVGAEIFHSKDIANSWDGKLRNGKEAPYGIYLYIISVKDLNNATHPYSGKITLKP